MSVCLSVSQSKVGVLLQWLKVGTAPAPSLANGGGKKGVEFEAARVETPNASRGWRTGTGYPPLQPTKGFVGSSVVSSPSGVRGRAPSKTILLLSMRVRTPLVATFVEN